MLEGLIAREGLLLLLDEDQECLEFTVGPGSVGACLYSQNSGGKDRQIWSTERVPG